jgi:hypothetical protein
MVSDKIMIKNMKWITCVIAVVLIVGIIFMLGIDKVNTTKISNGIVCFVYLDKNISTQLEDEYEKFVKKLFNDKRLYKDNPSCGFSENASISFNNGKNIFYIAQDLCPII